jgi:protein-S-isoprenylcysteine O-methyltransferase Ste14
MPVDTAGRKNRYYALAQSAILTLFAATAIFVRGPALVVSPIVKNAGEALCAVGLVLMAFAFSALRDVVQIAPDPKAGGHLVTTGIYRWLRHPIYTAIVILVIGLLLRKPAILPAVAAGVAIAFLIVKARYEETLLTARYPEYAEYRKRTWGVLPLIRS